MKAIMIVLAYIALTVNMHGQQFEIEDIQYPYESKVYDAIQLTVNAEKDEAKRAWNEFIQDNYNVDIKGYGVFAKKDELKTEALPMSFLSSEALILHTHFKEGTQNTEIYIYASRPDNETIYKKSDMEIYTNLENLTEEYVSYFLPDYHREVVDNMKKEYDDIVENIKDKNDDITKNKKEIIELQEEIRSLENEIIEAELNKDSAKSKLDKSIKILNKVKRSTSDLR